VARAMNMGKDRASQDKRRGPPEEETHQNRGEERQKNKENADWQTIKEDLISIKEGLEKEEEIDPVFAQRLSEVIVRVPHASHAGNAPQGVEARLERIEAMLRAPASSPQGSPPQGTTWARVAATGMRQAGEPHAILPTRHTVRVQLAQAKGMDNEEILKEVKKTISGAAAIRVLHSGDIDVTMPDEASKDRAHGLPSTEELKIYKKDYLIEVPGVPLGVHVACEKGADNTHLATAICEASRTVSPGLQITRIRWLHSQTRHTGQMREADDKPAKTRGSLIIGLPTQEMQRRAIRGGLVVDAQLFEVRPFERSLQPTQCFKCQQWGHTQGACGRRERCAQCAGDHATRNCPRERVSCANCGKQHRAWQRRECPSYQAYFQGIQNRRIALYFQAESMRAVSPSQALQTFPSQNEGWAVISRKRTRAPSPNLEDTQRRSGRPTHLEQAARDPTQQRLGFSQRNASDSQASSTESASVVEVSMTQDES
jgi:hypothetical protein